MNYKIFKETLYNEDIGTYESYGIKYMNNIFISDVSTDSNSLQGFVDELNNKNANIDCIYCLIDKFLSLQ